MLLICIGLALPTCGDGDGAFFDSESDLSDTSDQSDTSDTSEGDTDSDTDTDLDTEAFPPEGCDGVLSFPDASLEFVIREAIEKPMGDLYYSDVSGITTLTASDAD